MTMTRIPRDFLDLFRLLNQHGAKYLLVGGYAVVLHGNNRFTGDMDVFIQRTRENADGVRIMVIGRAELIANKLASGRDKDLLDVRKLTKGTVSKGRPGKHPHE